MSGSVRNIPVHATRVRTFRFADLPCEDGESTVSGSVTLYRADASQGYRSRYGAVPHQYIELTGRYSHGERFARCWQYSGSRLCKVETDWRLFLDPLTDAARKGGTISTD